MRAEVSEVLSSSSRTRGAACVAACAVVISSLLTSGCLRSKSGGLTPTTQGDKTEAPATVKSWPFVPKTIRIHPISQAQVDAKGPRILCHVECRDRTGETTKAIGTLRVELLEPSRTVEPGMEQIAATWVTDLSDLETNDKLYDPATRTYRLSLRQLPGFLVEGLNAQNKRLGQSAMLRATLEPAVLAGQSALPMSDEFKLTW